MTCQKIAAPTAAARSLCAHPRQLQYVQSTQEAALVVRDPDELGDRMKGYERSTEVRLNPAMPIIARIDGRAFSSFTRGCEKPFDVRVSSAMRAATAHLVEETHPKIAYVQSDEITLIWQNTEGGSVLFDGRVLKLCSVLASIAAVRFDRAFGGESLPSFDCRVWQVPSQEEAANTLLWRAMDARKNSVSSACRAHYSAKAMFCKSQTEMREMLTAAGVDFDTAYASEDRHGVYFRRVTGPREIDDEAWSRIPERHRPESRIVLRSWVEAIPMPFFGDVKNRATVIFDGANPETD